MEKGDLVRVRNSKKCFASNIDVRTEGYEFNEEMIKLFCNKLFEIEEIFFDKETKEKFYVLYDDVDRESFYFKKSMLKLILKGGE